jgi:hypothetical protein
MRHLFSAIGMFILIVCGQVSAQTTEQAFITKNAVITGPFLTSKAAAAVVIVSATALERFHKDYKNAKDVEWVEVPNGFRAYFLQDAVLTAVDYTRTGKLFSVIRYGEHLLSPYMRMKLEEAFDGLQIREVAEVKMARFTTKGFVVVLEDKTSVKTVQLIEDEISVVSEMDK